MPEFMIIGILLVLTIAWCVKDYRLRSEARRLQAKAEATKHIVDRVFMDELTLEYEGEGASEQEAFDDPWWGAGGVR